MGFTGYNYRIDSSLLIDKIGDWKQQICIFAKNKKDLKPYIKLLKEHGDKGTLKVQVRIKHEQFLPMCSDYKELYQLQLVEITNFLNKRGF